MPSGKIIILNGPSAAGKTSIQKEAQTLFDELYLVLGIDTFFDELMPEVGSNGILKSYTKAGEFIRGVRIGDIRGKPTIHLELGEPAQRVMCGMHRALRAYATAGNNLIVDYILYDRSWLRDLLESLEGIDVYFISVNLPLEVLEEREAMRSTSPAGHGRSHYDTVHAGCIYDLELDTSNLSPQECAEKVVAFVESQPKPKAVELMRKGIS